MKKSFKFISKFIIVSVAILIYSFINNNKSNSTAKNSNVCDDCSQAALLPYDCSYDLTDSTAYNFSTVDTTDWLYYYKTDRDTIFEWKDVSYNAEESCDPGNRCLDSVEQLKYKVIYPDYPYTTCTKKPPLVIFFHAGGFSDCNTIEEANHILQIATHMAHHGFICVTVEYRRGRAISDSTAAIQNNKKVYFTTAQQVLAYYRAFQDVRGAIRTIIKRNRETATPYKFDSTNIFLAGFSAGAICAINAAYYPTQAMINQIDQGADTVLGSINSDFYYGDTSIPFHSKIRGVFAGWGNAFIPLAYGAHPENFFPPSDTIPLICFHGELDWDVCPYDYQNVYFDFKGDSSFKDPNNHILTNPEKRCLPDNRVFNMPYGGKFDIDAYRFGSFKMYCFLRSIDTYTELYADPDMYHGIQSLPNDDFGTDFTNEDDVYSYIGGRMATFFQAALYNKTHPGFTSSLKRKRTYFEECVNLRHSCDTLNSNNCGSLTTNPCN